MVPAVLYTIISLSAVGVVAAVILYVVARRFRVFEDPRIDMVEDALPAANCGGCGYPGCRNFAEALVGAVSLEGYFCPVGGNETMEKVASLLGKEPVAADPLVAVVRCSGSFEHRPRTNFYDGAASCSIASALYTGDTDCPYGCLGLDECVEACDYDAMYLDDETGLPVVIDDNCIACGACVEACPRDIIELRKKARKNRKIYVSCINEDKGGVARKYCEVACIGCKKCFNICPHEAIEMGSYLAFIDSEKCKLCRKCVPECPTNSILEINFPPRKEKSEQAGETNKKNKMVAGTSRAEKVLKSKSDGANGSTEDI